MLRWGSSLPSPRPSVPKAFNFAVTPFDALDAA
ncbi:MAG: hypothetical protein RLY78_2685, partial [Pseudomonadota bacterium]